MLTIIRLTSPISCYSCVLPGINFAIKRQYNTMPGIVRLYACTPMYGNVSLCIHVHTFIKGVCCWRMFVYLLGIYSSRSHFVAIIRSLSLSFCLSYTICISRSASISVSICLYLSLSSSLCVFLCLSLCLSRLISLYLSLRGNFVYW